MKPFDDSQHKDYNWDTEKVPLVEETDLVRGGENGESNAATKILALRTANLDSRTKLLEEWKRLLTEEDSDSIVNTFAEIQKMFADMPEDADTIIKQLGNKVDKNRTDNGLIPAGTIVMWSGAIASIPSGWALCDGNNGTPNLKDRFIVGAGGNYNVGVTGGEATHTLSVNEMPSHSHGVSDPSHQHTVPGFQAGYNQQHDRVSGDAWNNPYNFPTNYSGTGIWINNAGGGAAHENRPPYYALAMIMKLPY